MSPEPGLNNADKEHPKAKTLSIEIEPSYPLIMATVQFFRAQKKPEQSLELCRLGLNYFPGDLGLRLGLAMAYLDLEEKDKAWTEIKAVAKELNQLAPILESISKHFQPVEQNKLADWFDQLSQILSKYPEEGLEITADSQVPLMLSEEKPERIKDETEITRNALHDSNVLSTLSGWLSKLQGGKA